MVWALFNVYLLLKNKNSTVGQKDVQESLEKTIVKKKSYKS